MLIQLCDLDWFQGLPAPELDRIQAACLRRSFEQGQRIIERGEPGQTVLFVLSGHVLAVQWTEGGREIVYKDIGPGAPFGELSVISGAPRSLSLYARTDCTVLELSLIHI